jgi:hypothetical protein
VHAGAQILFDDWQVAAQPWCAAQPEDAAKDDE